MRGPTPDAPLGDADLRAFVAARSLPARLVYPGAPTPTVPAAAAALGVAPERIVKSLVFLARGEPRLVVAAGERRIAYGRLAAALEVSRRRLRLASPEEALEITGFAVGAMPPFGHRAALPTLVDALSVPETGLVYCGGGARDALLELPAETLVEVAAARRAPLTQDDAAPAASSQEAPP